MGGAEWGCHCSYGRERSAEMELFSLCPLQLQLDSERDLLLKKTQYLNTTVVSAV